MAVPRMQEQPQLQPQQPQQSVQQPQPQPQPQQGRTYADPLALLFSGLSHAMHTWYQKHGVPIPPEARRQLLQEGVLLQVNASGQPKYFLYKPDGVAHEVLVNPQTPQAYQIGAPIRAEDFRRLYGQDLAGFFRVIDAQKPAAAPDFPTPSAPQNQPNTMFGMDPQLLMMMLLMMALMGRGGGSSSHTVPMQMTTVGYT